MIGVVLQNAVQRQIDDRAILASTKQASGDKLKVSSNNGTAAEFRSAIGGALTFCRHLISQLGFADVEGNAPNVSSSPNVRGISDINAAVRCITPTIRSALESCRGVFLSLGIISAVINILMLTGSFFMLQVYDRVLPSQSVPTLVGLALLATALYVLARRS